MTIFEFHILLVHFPIALLSTSVLFDISSVVFNKYNFQAVGWYNMVLGIFSAVCTAITGFLADTVLRHMDDPFPILESHGSLQVVAITLFVLLFLWRLSLQGNLPDKKRARIAYFSVSCISIVILFYGAHLGAILAGRL